MPGSASSRRAYVAAVGAAVERDVAPRPAPAQAHQGPAPRARHRQRRGVERRERLGGGEQPVSRAVGAAARRAARDQPARHGAAAAHRDLLAEDGADRDLVAVDVAGHPQPGAAPHERREQRVVGELVVDRDRVAVRVEQPAAALDRGGQVAQVVELQAAAHVAAVGHAVGPRSSTTWPPPCGSRRRAGVPVRPPASTPATTCGGRKREQLARGVRRAHGQPQLEPARCRRGPCRARRPRPQLGRRARRRPRGSCR